MESALEYLARANQALKQDYRNEDGNIASCSAIAIEVAKRLLAENKAPAIMGASSLPIIGAWKDTEKLIPIMYGGRVSFEEHLFCVHEGISYDPILGYPAKISEYMEKSFGSQKFPVKVAVAPQKIMEFIER